MDHLGWASARRRCRAGEVATAVARAGQLSSSVHSNAVALKTQLSGHNHIHRATASHNSSHSHSCGGTGLCKNYFDAEARSTTTITITPMLAGQHSAHDLLLEAAATAEPALTPPAMGGTLPTGCTPPFHLAGVSIRGFGGVHECRDVCRRRGGCACELCGGRVGGGRRVDRQAAPRGAADNPSIVRGVCGWRAGVFVPAIEKHWNCQAECSRAG